MRSRVGLAFCLGGLCLSGLTLPAHARDLDAKFLIERKGKVIGYHEVAVRETDFGLRVETDIEMKVKFGPITVFRYAHDATEIWRDDELISLVSTTNNNGDQAAVDAKRYGEALMIDGTGYKGAAPDGAMPSSYWDKELTQASAMINTQTGEVIEITTARIGDTMAPHKQIAEQFELVGTLALNLWYDGERWVGSNFTIDGEELTYVLVDEPQEFVLLDEWRGLAP